MKKIGFFLFKYRSYTPLPFVFIMIILMKPTALSLIIGAAVVISGELIRTWAVSYAGSETRTTDGVGGSNLVTQGPFSYIRNPLYLGNIMIYTGIGLMSNTFFPYLQIAGLIYFFFQYYCIIFNEEDFLRGKFGKNFELYCSSVNRFFPKFRSLPAEIRSDLIFDIKEGLRSEKRSLQAIIITSSIILIYFFFVTNQHQNK